MSHARRLALAFCVVFLFVAAVDSLTCKKCESGKCTKLEDEECKPPAKATPPPEAAPAEGLVEGRLMIQRADEVKMYCVTLKGKAKGGSDELTIRGCSADNKCTEYLEKLEPGAVCTPCETDKCNSGEHVTPLTLSIFLFSALVCLVTNF